MLNFLELYNTKKASAQTVAETVTSGMTIYTDTATAQAPTLQDAIYEHIVANDLKNIEINTFLDIYPAKWYDGPKLSENVHLVSWFNGNFARKAMRNRFVDYVTTYYSEAPSLFRSRKRIDIAILAASDMDEHGNFSIGISSSMAEALLEKADRIILEVNRKMPKSLASPIVNITAVDRFCVVDTPLPCLPDIEPDAESIAIGHYIAEEIVDGSTLQFGVGTIPNAVGHALRHKRNLGIHTEAFVSSMVDLIECGAVDNSRKAIHKGRSVATFALGNQKTYDYIHNNREIELLPVDYVNNPSVIAMNPNMISVNGAIECDLYGQVCSESIGSYQYSGVGGQVDFIRGAIHSKGGKSFLTFKSTAKNGEVSCILPHLRAGSIVTTTRNDVDYIVTEYGIAKLRGKPESVRAKSLIAIAHPKFRDQLTYEAKKMNLFI